MHIFITFKIFFSTFYGPWKLHHRPAPTLVGHFAATALEERFRVFHPLTLSFKNHTPPCKKKPQQMNALKNIRQIHKQQGFTA